jgi:replicative DNA helicase
MGWPEFGFGLAPDGDDATVQRWRGDRDRNRIWPKTLIKGGPFPWSADNLSTSNRQRAYEWKAA